mmetsp:Transcript_2976/g.10024  ORF Transcript_2976/g.10024 Transcript_2976/m.10024 type:complete len:264 (-) Transcript_2976:1784-2575(-)
MATSSQRLCFLPELSSPSSVASLLQISSCLTFGSLHRAFTRTNTTQQTEQGNQESPCLWGVKQVGTLKTFHSQMGGQESKSRYDQEGSSGLGSLCVRTEMLDHCRSGSHGNSDRSKHPSGTEKLIASFGSPLHAAAVIGYPSDINMLYEAGHDLERRDAAGRTACHLAASSGKLQNLQMLVHLGADLQAKDLKGDTPLQRATVANQSKVVQYIKWMIWSQQDKFSRESDSTLPLSRGTGKFLTDVSITSVKHEAHVTCVPPLR